MLYVLTRNFFWGGEKAAKILRRKLFNRTHFRSRGKDSRPSVDKARISRDEKKETPANFKTPVTKT